MVYRHRHHGLVIVKLAERGFALLIKIERAVDLFCPPLTRK
jgi:hypothetical protein